MRIKIFQESSLSDAEKEINYFLLERKDIEVIEIRELNSSRFWSFMIFYKIKEIKE